MLLSVSTMNDLSVYVNVSMAVISRRQRKIETELSHNELTTLGFNEVEGH